MRTIVAWAKRSPFLAGLAGMVCGLGLVWLAQRVYQDDQAIHALASIEVQRERLAEKAK